MSIRDTFKSPWFWRGVFESFWLTGTGVILGFLLGAIFAIRLHWSLP